MVTLDDLRSLGYEVGVAHEGVDYTAWRVTGFGIDAHVRHDDEDAIQRLIYAQLEAEKQQGESTTQTQLRWHEDHDNPFKLPDETAEALRKEID